MYSMDKIQSKRTDKLQKLDLSELPIKAYFDEESGTVVLESEYNIVIKTKGSIVSTAEGSNVMLGGEVHLNPTIDSINKLK